MNDTLILKMIKPLITEEKINSFIEYLTEKLLKEHAAEVERRDPERDVIGLAYFEDNEIYVAIAEVNASYEIKEIIRAEPLRDAVKRLLNNL